MHRKEERMSARKGRAFLFVLTTFVLSVRADYEYDRPVLKHLHDAHSKRQQTGLAGFFQKRTRLLEQLPQIRAAQAKALVPVAGSPSAQTQNQPNAKTAQ
jgi:hypothetical protein